MKKDNKKNLVSNEYTFLELPIEKYDFFDDPEVLKYIYSLNFDRLNQEEIKDLIIKKDTDKKARDKLIKYFLHLPIMVASEYSTLTTLSNIDLISEGNMGLMEFINNYHCSNFDYMVFYRDLLVSIQKSIENACVKIAKSDSISKSTYDRLLKLNQIENNFKEEYGRIPLDEEMFVEWEDKSKKLLRNQLPKGIIYNRLKELRNELESFDTLDKDKELGEDLSIDLDKVVELSFIRDIIMKGLENPDITNEERYVLMSLYGFIEEKTTKELSEELNISMSDIYKIQKSAFKKIKKYTYFDLDGFRDNPRINKQR